MTSLIGQRLGQYEIVALLGKGGMATVYRARQLNIQRDVALKVIKPELAETPDFVQRFKREAETIATLSHPHILKLFDYGQQDDIAYLVMELLTGGSLGDLLRDGSLTVRQSSRLLDQIASALDYAHRHGVIHRDLKPQNILLDDKDSNHGNAFLTDFGIAKLLTEHTALTQSGLSIGTPAYMAPEQWMGQPVDARTDVYALGIILFEMLSGKLPFKGDTPYSMMHLHVNELPPSLGMLRRDIPPTIDQIITRALAKQCDQRFPSAGELASAYRAAIADISSSANDATASAIAGDVPTVTGLPESPTPEAVKALETAQVTAPVKVPATQTAGRNRNSPRGLVVLGVMVLILASSVGLFMAGQSKPPATITTSVAPPTLTPGVVAQSTTIAGSTAANNATATPTANCAVPVQTLSALQTAVIQVTVEATSYQATFTALRSRK